MSRRLAHPLAGAAVAALLSVLAAAAVEIPGVPLEPAFILREGEPRDLEGTSPHPGEVVGFRVRWPEGEAPERFDLAAPGAALGKAVPLAAVPSDPRADGEDVMEVLLLGLGEMEVPPFALLLADGGTVRTAPVTLETVPGLAEEDQEPAPARDQATLGLEPLGLAMAIMAVLVPLGALVALLLWLRRRRRTAETPAAPAEPEVPPGVWAHQALDALLNSDLLARGEMKVFHVRLSAIAKEYLSRRFRISLMERTTAECPSDLRRAGVDASLTREVGQWLGAIDMVKFAGERPGSGQVVASVQALRDMVDATSPRSQPAAAVGAGEA